MNLKNIDTIGDLPPVEEYRSTKTGEILTVPKLLKQISDLKTGQIQLEAQIWRKAAEHMEYRAKCHRDRITCLGSGELYRPITPEDVCECEAKDCIETASHFNQMAVQAKLKIP